ncbi:hypothetical protein ADK76_28940 [Streptomyces griseoflavus]|uniref:hypothetical protein n=1 Tax=Streptomyces rimosus TaxID=1927 RepID=UPI0004C9278A|nr:hypothetical protein [Streptomyces rimosus]KOG53142.1 hypothetical protein ADK76_28940 [Streptomyces griseoflavus]
MTDPAPLTPQQHATVERLLGEAFSDSVPPAPIASPVRVPPGYTIRETHRIGPDGGTETVYEVVPLLAPPPPALLSASSPHRQWRLPDWLLAHPRRVAAGTGVAIGGIASIVWAPQIAAGATAIGAVLAVGFKVLVALAVIGAVVAVCTPPGRRRTGTFEGTVRGRWEED